MTREVFDGPVDEIRAKRYDTLALEMSSTPHIWTDSAFFERVPTFAAVRQLRPRGATRSSTWSSCGT